MAATAARYAMSSTLFYDTLDIVTNTNKRDVSDILDLWVSKETPALNYIKWGPDSGGTQIEWIAERRGKGFVQAGEITGTAIAEIEVVPTAEGNSISNVLKQIHPGAILVGYSSDVATHVMLFVESTTLTATASGAISFGTNVSATIDAGTKLYILGNFVNEGSDPEEDITPPRTVVTNNFAIQREDIAITGSMAATDMYGVASELRHQMKMRLLKMQQHKQMAIFWADDSQLGGARVGGAAGTGIATIFNGIDYFLRTYNSGTTWDQSTTVLTESDFNSTVANLWDENCKPNAVFGCAKQIRKFTEWDRARVRTTPDAKMGGFHVTKYLTDIGYEVDVVPIQNFPVEGLFILDTSKIRLRAKKGRKLLIEKLGKTGDYDQYQLLSEFSLEIKGGTINTAGGGYGALT